MASLLATSCATPPRVDETDGFEPTWTPAQIVVAGHYSSDPRQPIRGVLLGLPHAFCGSVDGLNLSLWQVATGGGSGISITPGVHSYSGDYYGVQLALGGNFDHSSRHTKPRKRMVGAQLSAFNAADQTTGAQLGLSNFNHGTQGLQIGAINLSLAIDGAQTGVFNGAGTGRGVQIGAANHGDSFTGLQTGIYNGSETGRGVQLGLCNQAGTLCGAQVGLWNSATSGFQIGLINHNENGLLPWFPLVNW